MNTTLQSFDPSNGELLGELPKTSPEMLQIVIAQARVASKTWGKLSHDERLNQLVHAYSPEAFEPNIEKLSELLSREMGKDIRRSHSEVQGTIYGAPHIAENAAQALHTRNLGHGVYQEYRPLGIAGVISPWNYPLAMANNLIIPALIAGNPVIFKPSEETPLIAHKFVEHLNKYLPEHVLQTVYGDGSLGKELVESDINLIAFTGSQAVGKDIMARASGQLKRLIMELGGNDPMIVMANANLKAAAHFAVASSLENSGQMCTSTERIYVDRKIADRFEKMVTSIASNYKTGPWNLAGVHVGPIINRKQHQNIVAHIQDAESKGARILLGGSDQSAPYIIPTVVADTTPQMMMEQAETFGPVVAISRFETIEEAVVRANETNYGLGAVVFGGQGAREVAAQLDAGMVAVNQGVGAGGDVPWVGAKQSGYGFHGSEDGHRQFAQVRVIST